MLPHDLTCERLRLPDGLRDSAVLFTGSSLRHLRLGYLVQQRFPGLLKRWWATDRRLASRVSRPTMCPGLLRRAGACLSRGDIRGLAAGVARRMVSIAQWTQRSRGPTAERERDIERRMFAEEVDVLRRQAVAQPEITTDPNADDIVLVLRTLQPYFLLTFGGPLLRRRVLETVRGIAVNQHAGWSPALRGTRTTEAALYHRKLNWIGSTAHLMDTHADAGPVLRRSCVTVHPDDTISHCFMAVCALGTHMLLEVVDAARAADTLPVFPQPIEGETLLRTTLSSKRVDYIRSDLQRGWLSHALTDVRRW